MEKLDKETISKEQLGSGYKDYELVKISYISGLEYAENHYLAKLEEQFNQFQEIIQKHNILHERNGEAMELMEKDIQQAKELLKEAKNLIFSREGENDNTFKKIEEFLNKTL
tara:strand:+ start:1192 stop:1527 length:336 start_codon:yes stop_codon:yes gene_type:complete